MPILRLVLIYVLLALAVVGVFKRDRLMLLVLGETKTPAAETVAAVKPVETAPAPAPAAQPETVAAAGPAPVYPDSAASAHATASVAPGTGALQAPVAAAPAGALAQAPEPQPAAAAAVTVPVGEVETARRAYWEGRFDEAGTLLSRLTDSHPDNPDLFGELGNFHFSQGHRAEAAAAYLRAGELLVAQGRAGQAMPLVAVLQQLDADKAVSLNEKLGSR